AGECSPFPLPVPEPRVLTLPCPRCQEPREVLTLPAPTCQAARGAHPSSPTCQEPARVSPFLAHVPGPAKCSPFSPTCQSRAECSPFLTHVSEPRECSPSSPTCGAARECSTLPHLRIKRTLSGAASVSLRVTRLLRAPWTMLHTVSLRVTQLLQLLDHVTYWSHLSQQWRPGARVRGLSVRRQPALPRPQCQPGPSTLVVITRALMGAGFVASGWMEGSSATGQRRWDVAALAEDLPRISVVADCGDSSEAAPLTCAELSGNATTLTPPLACAELSEACHHTDAPPRLCWKYLGGWTHLAVLGSDTSINLLHQCRRRNSGDVSVASVLQLPHRGGCFDAVICIAVLRPQCRLHLPGTARSAPCTS
ncbi:hypothetical protein CYMTET_33843, partial [Cymbomonas tetramitiformis]